MNTKEAFSKYWGRMFEDGDFEALLNDIDEIIKTKLFERDKFWAQCLQEHRKYCTAQGNKELTKVKRKFFPLKKYNFK